MKVIAVRNLGETENLGEEDCAPCGEGLLDSSVERRAWAGCVCLFLVAEDLFVFIFCYYLPTTSLI